MSIRDLIQDAVKAGELTLFKPLAPGSTIRRTLLMTRGICDFLEAEDDEEQIERCAHLQADLERFVSGGAIGPKFLFLLYPASSCVWEIRSVQPSPSIRVLGLFPERDIFIATNIALREQLGGWESRAWRDVRVEAATIWRRLFLTYQPLGGAEIHDKVTGANDGNYFRSPPEKGARLL